MRFAILGPTASGKSTLAVEVARRVAGTVVNGDPFQALGGLSIGTGQPSLNEQGGVPHLGYGLFTLDYRPNPVEFGNQVRAWIESVEISVLVTGSGLYLRGIWDQLSALPDVAGETVARVRRWSQVMGAPRLHRVLAGLDPKRAGELHPNDSARVTRALALHLATGEKPSTLLSGVLQGAPEGWRCLVVQPDREHRRDRVERRVAQQVEAGWKEEVARLLATGHGDDLEALRALGYAALAQSGADPVPAIIQETQAFAKRQATWFRTQLPEVPRWDPDAEPLEAAFAKLGIA